jgi:hypothetical protein
MWAAVQFVCFLIIVYWIIKHAFPARPDPYQQKLEQDRKHAELMGAVSRLERQRLTPTATTPSFDAARNAGAAAWARNHIGRNNSVETPIVHQPEAVVIKSGLIDGMPYKLYSDGAIEAELPQGLMHFRSLLELQRHLEQNA